MLLRGACILVLCGILVAGLWPFHAPRNNVRWIGQGTGVEIAKYGSIVTAGEFANRSSAANDSCSLEIWLAPKRASASGTILAFYRPESHSSPFAMRQSLGDLSIESLFKGQPQSGGKAKVYADDLFSHPKLVLFTIASNAAGTAVYADGSLVKTFPKFRFASEDLTGRLILGNSPFSTHEWTGEVKGLAIYAGSLTPEVVLEHYEEWTSGGEIRPDPRMIALYRFDEAAGILIHNRADASTDLTIPSHFFILDERFLEPPWREFHNDRRYWKDVVVNIAGFIPLGLLFFACFSKMGRKHPAALTIVLGFVVSLTIEVGQSFLPSRNSGMTDLITNTLGTSVGVLLFRFDLARTMLAALGMIPRNTTASSNAEQPIYEMVPAEASNSAR